MGFFEIISILSLCLSIAAIFLAVQAMKANLYQAKQLQTLYQALAALQVYFYEEEEWAEDLMDDDPPRPPASHHKVIDLFTGMPVEDEED